MIEVQMTLDVHPGQFVLLPHGLFRLANPEAVVRGRVHVFRYCSLDQFTTIVAIGLSPGGARSES
jgi:hypothetical protein